MPQWTIDDSSYRDAFIAAVTSLFSDGFVNLANKISVPDFVSVSDEYVQSSRRLLILGQESAGQNWSAAHCKELDPDSQRWLAWRSGEYQTFNLGEGSWSQNTTFWRGFEQATDLFYCSSGPRNRAAWANLCLAEPQTDRNKYSEIPTGVLKKFINWQRPLFRAMLEFLKPTHILCFTGPDFDYLLFQMLSESAVPGLSRECDLFSIRRLINADVVRTYHPTYLNRSNQWSLIEKATNLLFHGSEHRA